MLLLNSNLISRQIQSLSLSHGIWSQMKSSIPSKKKGQRENSHTRCMKNWYQESSFHSFGFTMTVLFLLFFSTMSIYRIGWGWINSSLSREDVTSVVWIWIRFGQLSHLERFRAQCHWSLLSGKHLIALSALLHGLDVCPLEVCGRK